MGRKIIFVIHRLSISGALHVILTYAKWLLEVNNDVSIITLEPNISNDWVTTTVPIYYYKEATSIVTNEIDIAIATFWMTVSYVESIHAKKKFHFIQADERRCIADVDRVQKINKAYDNTLISVVNSKWLYNLWSVNYNKRIIYIPNSLDSKLFYHSEPYYKKSSKPRVLLEGNVLAPYKGVIDSYNAVKGLNCELWVASSYWNSAVGVKADKIFVGTKHEGMQKIYNSCDVLLKMSKVESFYLPPLEAMACGCAVVTGKVAGYDEYIVDGYNALVVNQGDISGATKAVQTLIDNKAIREVLIGNGFKTVKEWPVENSRKAVLQYFT